MSAVFKDSQVQKQAGIFLFLKMKLLGSTIFAAALGGEVRPRPDDLTGTEAKCQPDADRDSFSAGKFPEGFKERIKEF